MLLKILNIFLKILKYFGFFLIVLLLLLYIPHLVAPKYNFAEQKKFAGPKFYNPYKNIIEKNWIRGNFHMHSNAWGGITNGSKNSDIEIWKTYKNLGFKSISISNYQTINEYNADSSFYIPNYEHGYGIFKNHHLNLGAKKVVWFDMPLKQSISEKQFMMNLMKKNTELLSVNHPSFFRGFKPKDFSLLTGYDFIEVLNGYRNSIPYWDSALSAGRPALIMANDDMHDIFDVNEPANRFNLINTNNNHKDTVLSALSQGQSIGIYVKRHNNETFEKKKNRLDNMSLPKIITIQDDNFIIEMTKNASRFDFIGQNGRLLKRIEGGTKASYTISNTDPYVRAVVYLPTDEYFDGIQLFLNPIMRSNDGEIPIMPVAKVNLTKTILNKILILAVVICFVGYFYKRSKRKKINK